MINQYLSAYEQLSSFDVIGFRLSTPVTKSDLDEKILLANALISNINDDYVSLYFDDTLDFTAHLFACWQRGKIPVLPGDAQPESKILIKNKGIAWVDQQGYIPSSNAKTATNLAAEIVLLTSGSTGEPTFVSKTLAQLNTEVAVLTETFPSIGNTVAATITHQHIYGFLFKVLWPIKTARKIVAERWHYPEQIIAGLNEIPSLCLISSPAHLSRVGNNPKPQTPFVSVFSSGGPLAKDHALSAANWLGCNIQEVYGSTETGGIAYRSQSAGDTAWTPFPGINISEANENSFTIESPYLSEPQLLSDKLKLYPNSSFDVIGRQDRIVKIHEKRVSLTHMENILQKMAGVEKAHILVDASNGRLNAVIQTQSEVIFENIANNKNWLRQTGLNLLKEHFESTLIPKRWRCVKTMPENLRGKVNQSDLEKLFVKDDRLPRVLAATQLDSNSIELTLDIASNLPWFSGHFPGQPILPGVASTFIVHQMAVIWLGLKGQFIGMDAVKYQAIIKPDDQVQLSLKWNSDTQRLTYCYLCNEIKCGTGKLKFDK